mmetsp:Transcript_9230/g.13390  ORF Transcript_9230/g.13390 Transcript_9230/m.13390 type:complete len:145 (+) Transcript_9230:1762-2196(+)
MKGARGEISNGIGHSRDEVIGGTKAVGTMEAGAKMEQGGHRTVDRYTGFGDPCYRGGIIRPCRCTEWRMCRWSMQDGSVMGDGGGQLKHGVVDTPVRVSSRHDIGLYIGREGAAPDIRGGVRSPGRRQLETPPMPCLEASQAPI